MKDLVDAFLIFIFYAKVFHNKYRSDGFCFVKPNAGSVFGLVSPMGFQALLKGFIDKLVFLGESIHMPFATFTHM